MNRNKIRASLFAYMLGLAFVVTFATSCNDDDDYRGDTYWISMATVEAPGQTGSFALAQESFSLLNDDNETLYPAYLNYYIGGYTTKNQQRVLIDYVIMSDERNGYDHYIRLNNLTNVLTKPMAILAADTAATSPLRGTDPIVMNDVWIANDYVNIVFSYKGTIGSTHYINLIKNLITGPTPNPNLGVLTLNFVHDAKDDAETYWFKGIVSFLLPNDLTGVTTIKIEADNFGTTQTVTRPYGASDPAPKIRDLDNPTVK